VHHVFQLKEFVLFTGAHTQHIERVWREVRANIPRYGTRSDHVEGYLFKFLYKRAHPRAERIENFFDLIAQLYPPMSPAECQNQAEAEYTTDTETSNASFHK